MSCVTQTAEKYTGGIFISLVAKLFNALEGFFRTRQVTRQARIWHGDFSYSLVPNTAIKTFCNMNPVTSIYTGDCYVCCFEDNKYGGYYRIIGPGEKAEIRGCASVVVSTEKVPADCIGKSSKAPDGFWEMDGPMYLAHFSSAYRYA